MEIESPHSAQLTFKIRSNLKFKNKYIERNYSQSGDSIHSVLGLLDRSWFPLSNEYKFIRVAYIYR
jgi:hypothetical protein